MFLGYWRLIVLAATLPLWNGMVRLGARATGQPDVAATPAGGRGAPVHLTAQQDRERMLRLLGIPDSAMRPQSSTDAKAANAANFDESKADMYPSLPQALVLNDGQKVTSAALWWHRRRPEIVAEFDREILGVTPQHLPRVTWRMVQSKPQHADGMDVITRRVAGQVDNAIDRKIPVNIDLLLVTPAHAAGPVPVILELASAPEFETALAGPAAGAPDKWAVPWQPVLRRGWAFAMLDAMSVQADNGAGLTEGIIGLMNRGQQRGLEDWEFLRRGRGA